MLEEYVMKIRGLRKGGKWKRQSGSLPDYRDPNSHLMIALRKSGAAGVHQCKIRRDASVRKMKHKVGFDLHEA
jgi:hypothetical protein